MFSPTIDHSGIFYLFTGLAALLTLAILIALLTPKDSPCSEGGSSTAFGPEWLTRAPDDVRRMERVRGSRRLITLELLAECTWECCSKIREEIGRIRR
jgi:hypothetical protein